MPKVDAFDTMLISKPSGYCDDNDAMSFIEYDGRIVFDISTEGYGCIGWASVVAIGDPPRWQMVEFGGSGR